jgi:hypothetical protein
MQADAGAWDSLSENFESVFGLDGILTTANEGELRLTAFVSANAPDISALPDGEWMEIAPFGDFPAPDGRHYLGCRVFWKLRGKWQWPRRLKGEVRAKQALNRCQIQ